MGDVDIAIARIAPEHIEGFNKVVDFVARERRYLAFLGSLRVVWARSGAERRGKLCIA